MSDVRIYRASEIGGCLKSQVAAKLDYQRLATPQKMLDVFAAGNDAEVKVGELLREEGWSLFGEQQLVTIDVTPMVRLEGHVDWLGSSDDDAGVVIECKSMSDPAYGDWIRMGWDTPGLIQKYKWQLSSYMNGLGLPGVIVAYNRLTGDWHTTDVPEPFVTTGELKARVLEIDRWVRLGELPVACDVDMWPCAFGYLHEVELSPENFEIEEVALAYQGVVVSERTNKESKAKLRRLLDDATGRKTYKGERLTVTYFERRNPARWDEQKVRDAGINPDDLKTESGKSTQVRVTIHDEGGSGDGGE